MDPRSTIPKTVGELRRELSDLKRCQLQYFVISITATSAILGLAMSLDSAQLRGIAALTPLALLIPSWIIFLEKAKTTTRIAGYQIVLESLSFTEWTGNPLFLGYETALLRYREEQDSGRLEVQVDLNAPNFLRIFFLRTRHRFWVLNWYTFLSLSTLCALVGNTILPDERFTLGIPGFRSSIQLGLQDIGLVSLILVVTVAVFTFIEVRQLIRGRYSISGSAAAWRELKLMMDNDWQGGDAPNEH